MGNGTSLGRVRGLGSAHSGAHHWLLQRFTAVGNLLLVGYFIVSLVLLPDLAHGTVIEWLRHPVSASAMALLVISTFWHARLGLQVLIEDYLPDAGNRFAALAVLNFAAFGGGAFGVISIARIALGGAA
ncbi:succinate dehydrogenase, hydrophobic membrane anchor protein [Altererythrobacter xixiisoli]|uniref:Succinate dehydrogenase hydrophobic membrane anchor subunit n=1 Tax=Croceibacterium xixiisoli TaxID=1476466 RepID=A0A6I4TV24_9SPHN|nr:succinate dehydrogenase, hydrophobic membrane anchor protein [Croceibacterium xixiisoli]MXO99079.1 succinate dehydrogenase, hydrophobic membrane anchor protein [Croceibacterium xixiisoli]